MSDNLPGVVDVVLTVRAILITPKKEILLIKRSKDNRTDVGKWEFPGGKMEQGQKVDETLKRELQEEIGIKITSDKNTRSHYLDLPVIIPGYEKIQNVCILKEIKLKNTPKIKLSHEHDGFVWITKSKALKKTNLRQGTRQVISNINF